MSLLTLLKSSGGAPPPGRYWVGGTATWNGTAGTKWATTPGGAGGASAPTAADDVFFDAASGAVAVTLSAVPCRSLNCTGFTGTLLLPSSTTVTIGDATAGAGNVALLLSAAMTLSIGSAAASIMLFASTSATQQTVTTGGKTLGSVTINGVGSSYLLADSTATLAASTVTLTAGTLDTGNQICSWGLFSSSNSNARTLTLGSSSVTLTGVGNAWLVNTVTNLTLNAGTSTLTLTGATASFWAGAAGVYNNVVLSGSGTAVLQLSAGVAFANLTRTGTATKTDGLSVAASFTVTGTLTLTGNSTVNRVLVQSTVLGTSRTITAAVVSLTNVDFMDIAGAGAAAPFAGTSLGDAQGNSGITFDAPVTQTHTASAGGNWSDATKWTSRVPLPQDDVVVDVNTTGTLTADMPRLGHNLTFTGFAGTWAGTVAWSSFGNLTLATGMTVTTTAAVLAGRGAHSITSVGKSFVSQITIQAPGGSYTLQDAIATTSNLIVSDGTFTANDFNVTAFTVAAASARACTINMGSGTWTLTGLTGNVWSVQGSLTTVNAQTSSLVIGTASTSLRTLVSGTLSAVYNVITYTVANSPGALASLGVKTITTLNVGSGRTVTFPSSIVTTATNWNVQGEDSDGIYLPGVVANYVSVPDSAALSPVGDLDLRVAVALDDWTPVAEQTLVAKYAPTGNQRSYDLGITTTGMPIMRTSTDGTGATVVIATSTVAPAVANGALLGIRVTVDVVDGANKTYKFWTKATTAATAHADMLADAGWTLLDTITTAGNTTVFDGTAALTVGAYDSGATSVVIGKFYSVVLKTGIDGATQLAADFTAKAVGADSFVEGSANAAMVSIIGALARVGDGRVSIGSSTPGTQHTLSKPTGTVNADYLVLQDSVATGGAAWYAGSHSVNVSGNTGWFFKDQNPPLALSGTLTPTGSFAGVRRGFVLLDGTVGPGGTVVRQANRALGGTSTPNGLVTRLAALELAGTMIPAGSVSHTSTSVHAGSVTPTGTGSRLALSAYAGSVLPTGATAQDARVSAWGLLTPVGSLVQDVALTVAGALSSSSHVANATTKLVAGSVSPGGILMRRGELAAGGELGFQATTMRQASKLLQGVLTAIGTLVAVPVRPRYVLVQTIGFTELDQTIWFAQ